MNLEIDGVEIVLDDVGIFGPDIEKLIQRLKGPIENGVGGLGARNIEGGRNQVVITTNPERFNDLTNSDQLGGRNGLTSTLVPGQYTIWFDAVTPGAGLEALLHELGHPFGDYEGEKATVHEPEHYLDSEEIARAIGERLNPNWGVTPSNRLFPERDGFPKGGTSFEESIGKYGLTQQQVNRLVDLLATDPSGNITPGGAAALKRLYDHLKAMGYNDAADDFRDKLENSGINADHVIPISFGGTLSDETKYKLYYGYFGDGDGFTPGLGSGSNLPGLRPPPGMGGQNTGLFGGLGDDDDDDDDDDSDSETGNSDDEPSGAEGAGWLGCQQRWWR
jgi:hypothetical protein